MCAVLAAMHNVSPDQINLLIYAANKMHVRPMDWNDVYDDRNVLLTRVDRDTRNVTSVSRTTALSIAFEIPILDYSWLIQSSILGHWLSKSSFLAAVPEVDRNLFTEYVFVISLRTKEDEDVAVVANRLGARTIFSNLAAMNPREIGAKVAVYISDDLTASQAWGIFPGSWMFNLECIDIGVQISVRKYQWFYDCVGNMKIN